MIYSLIKKKIFILKVNKSFFLRLIKNLFVLNENNPLLVFFFKLYSYLV